MVENTSDVPFMDRIWYQSWFNHRGKPAGWVGPLFGPEINGCYIPLAWIQKCKLRFACLAGSHGPLRDIGLFNPASLMACVKHLEKNGVGAALRLGPVSDKSSNISALLGVLRQRGWHIVADQIGFGWVIDWSEQGFDHYWTSLSKKKLHRIEYYHRLMERNGDVKIRHYRHSKADEWKQILADLADVEANSWIAENGEPRFLGADNQGYWLELCRSENFLRAANVWMIYFEGKPVSFLFALDGRYTRYFYSNSYNKSVSRYSTGSTLYKMAFLDAYQQGLKCMDLGLGNSGYKTLWGAKAANRVMNYLCFPPTLAGSFLSKILCVAVFIRDKRIMGIKLPKIPKLGF